MSGRVAPATTRSLGTRRRALERRRQPQRRRPLQRRKRPGFFRVERPRQLWQLDMTSVWVAERGWCYLMAAIDCCTREIVAWQLELRCRAEEAIALIERAAVNDGIEAGELVLGSDNAPAFTARRFKLRLAELRIRHRRGGYRDPESQAFVESWFGKLKEREVWLNEYETLDDARRGIRGYVNRCHHRPSLRARLPDAPGGASDLGGSTENRGLNCQHGRGSRSGMALTFIPSDLIEQAAREENWTDSDRQHCSRMLRQAFEESFQVKEIQRSVNGLIAYDSPFVSFESVRFQEGADKPVSQALEDLSKKLLLAKPD